jgi:antitoxin (DNA-binding transcriptional repressor) of toxin-antitoxin stability system
VIYEFPNSDAAIRQGDIFVGLPRVEVSLREIPVITDDGQQRLAQWREIVQAGQPVTAVFAMRPVAAIVATQDCDTLRAPDITLCEIRRFQEVERKAAQTSSAKSWKNILTQHARINQKWFYLPPNERLGFADKQAVDFLVTLRVPREELEEMRDLRRGRLNDMADEHFRERIADFFRRYPYDEWYSLNHEELAAYQQEYPDTIPYPWQHVAAPEDGS